MKLALIIERFWPAGGGAERGTREVAEQLCARGHEVTILCGQSDPAYGEGQPYAVRISPFGPPRDTARLLAFRAWTARQLGRGGYDASLSAAMTLPASVVQPLGGTVRETLARNVAMRTSPRKRLTKKLSIALSPKYQTMLALERQTVRSRRVRYFAAISDYVVRQLTETCGVAPARVEMVLNAVDLELPPADQRAIIRRQVREAFSIPQSATVYLFAAFNPRLKGLPQLIEALDRLRQREPSAVLMVAGQSGYSEIELIDRLSLREHVRLVGPTRKMAELYAAADVTVLPSFYDSSGRVVIESLLAGVPAVTTAYAGAADLVERADGRRCGRVIDDPRHTAALTDALAELADPEERRRCSAATEGMAEMLSLGRYVDRLESLLKRSAE
ncbi:MAG: glycosyltransferase family 4 protein [Phycisphaeraceae bacterium]